MSSCCSCTAAQSAPPVRPQANNPLALRAKTITAAADRLGLKVDDLKSALRSGSTLNRIAASRGVGHDELIAAISGVLATDGTRRTGAALTDAAEAVAAGRTLRV